MYSRRFSNGSDLPPDYSGVAFREDARENDARKEETERGERREPYQNEYSEPNREVYREQYREPYREQGTETERPPFERPDGRRPPLAASGPQEAPPLRPQGGPGGTGSGGSGAPGGSGGLSSLFSFGGRSFSLEDVILAGLILLLIGDKDGGKPDGELLLILGLLLLSK